MFNAAKALLRDILIYDKIFPRDSLVDAVFSILNWAALMGHDDEDMVDILLRGGGVVEFTFGHVEGNSNRYSAWSTV